MFSKLKDINYQIKSKTEKKKKMKNIWKTQKTKNTCIVIAKRKHTDT